MQLDTVRYCAFADPGQVQEGDTKVGGLDSMDIEEASEFFRNTSTNYSNLISNSSRCRKPFPWGLLEEYGRTN